ncbi:hypothetical protein BRC83_06630 [Halobacteriales archaeon QS_1_68_17]|nr:MAG: hypothetical protein BRC83_06630 [Halobacteriales archaeon QS_1_68_17]
MIVRVGDRVRRGRAVSFSDVPVDAGTVAAAVRGTAADVAVECPDPGPVHDRVGLVTDGMGLRTRTALAEAARSRGTDAPQDEQVATLRERLDDLDPPDAALAVPHRDLADLAGEVTDLRERVAERRGAVAALRDAGGDAETARSDLVAAARELSEVETERIAARQRLDDRREAARAARDVRERRLRLEDRIANLEREARAHLVETVRTEFASAVRELGHDGDPFDAGAATAALGVARVADLAAPVVLDCDRFPDATAAADWLDAPVIRL